MPNIAYFPSVAVVMRGSARRRVASLLTIQTEAFVSVTFLKRRRKVKKTNEFLSDKRNVGRALVTYVNLNFTRTIHTTNLGSDRYRIIFLLSL